MTIRSASPPPDYPALLERAQRALRRDPELRAARACTPTHDGCIPDDGIGRYPRTAPDHDDVRPDDHVVIQPAPRADPRAVAHLRTGFDVGRRGHHRSLVHPCPR